MHRKIEISKETLDKVRLAKKYIEDRYQGLLDEQIDAKQNLNQKGTNKQISKFAKNKQLTIMNRLQRQKDSLKNYQLNSIIGRGAFGEVRLARQIESGQFVAIKRLKKQVIAQKKQIYNAYLEKELMGSSQSRYLVQMYSAFQDEEYLYIVMEYLQGGDLLHLLIEKDILTEEQTRFFIAQMVLAVQEVHKMGFVHRDIKPDNILLDSRGHIKISDFGLSKYINPNKKKKGKLTKLENIEIQEERNRVFSKVGTPDYISPEVLMHNTYDQSIDIWGIGVIMFQCLYGYPPFSDEDSSQVCCHVLDWLEYLQFPEDIQVSTSARMLILGLINDHKKRLSVQQIKKHAFFEGIDWHNLHKYKSPYVPPLKDQFDVSNFDKFQISSPWTAQQSDKIPYKNDQTSQFKEQQNNVGKQKKSSHIFYSFAGFDFRRQKSLKVGQRSTINGQRMSCQHKSLKKIVMGGRSQKRLKTEEHHKKVIKNPYTKYEKNLKSLLFSKMKQRLSTSLKKGQVFKQRITQKKVKKIDKGQRNTEYLMTQTIGLRKMQRNSEKQNWKIKSGKKEKSAKHMIE